MTISYRTTDCPSCGVIFKYRSNKKFCSANCRKASSQKALRKITPANAANCTSIQRDQTEVFDLAMKMAETYYCMPPAHRLGYLEEVVQQARSGDCPRVRKILTNPAFIWPDRQEKHLFYRRTPGSHLTIAQAANHYCRSSPWSAPVSQVVRGEVPEPPTGEVQGPINNITAIW